MPNADLLKPPQKMRELNLLEEFEKNPVVSQRELSIRFGMSLGVTNTCLKEMAKKGLIQKQIFSHHRIGYYLTPRGIAEKGKLSFDMLLWTKQHYWFLKNIIRRILVEMQNMGIERIVFYGVADEMEIAYVTLQGLKLKLIGIIEDEERMSQKEMLGFKLAGVEDIIVLKPDGILITSISGIDQRRRTLEGYIEASRVKVISI
jgi:hypothetical protein